ncbi:hypothetical protein [Paraburkholderia heleia]|uniref:hypothetical protein n=1 Tax=Paraburkholderia heleia TaxID=634127 RepID=UPI0031DA9430
MNLPVDAASGKITGTRTHSHQRRGKGRGVFRNAMEGVKVCGINPGMANAKLAQASTLNHVEAASMMYDRITWHYLDGNIKYTDSWNERA